MPQHSFHRPAPFGLDPDGKPIRTDPLSTRWCYCSARVVRFYPVGCLLPLCCRASAVPNKGWLDAMAGDDMLDPAGGVLFLAPRREKEKK